MSKHIKGQQIMASIITPKTINQTSAFLKKPYKFLKYEDKLWLRVKFDKYLPELAYIYTFISPFFLVLKTFNSF
jgi:hypothetical protein